MTGAGGQDGILLSRLLVEEGYRVIGAVADAQRASSPLRLYAPAVELVQLDVRDRKGVSQLLDRERPDEVYNLASWSSVGKSWVQPWEVTEVNGLAVLGLLQEILTLRDVGGYEPRVLQASSSEMFGLVRFLPQDEESPHHPRSPYATAKSFAHHTAINFRESYGLHIATTILFNHESPLRPRDFVTRKITAGVAEIAAGRQETLTLGRTDIRRDWGSAADYVRAMRLALSTDEPSDYCIATGRSHSLAEFVETAFRAAGLADGMERVISDPGLFRPADVPETRGDSSKAHRELGWVPSLSFSELVSWMVQIDMRRLDTGVEDDASYLR